MQVEEYRQLLVALAGFSIALNMFVAFQWSRAWFRTEDKELRRTLRGPALYPVVAALVCMNVIYWRVNDNSIDLPFGPGDFTALIPLLGFMVAAWVSLGNYARVENLMLRLTKLEKENLA